MIVETFLISASIVVAYFVVANRSMRMGRAVRKWSLDEAVEVLRDPAVSQARKDDLRFIVGKMMSRRAAWFLLIALLVAVPMLFISRKGDDWQGIPDHQRKRWSRLQTATMIATLSNSPAAALLFTIVFAALSFFFSAKVIAEFALDRFEHKLGTTRLTQTAC